MLVNSKISIISLTKNCYYDEGILGFYKGMLSPLVSFSIINGFCLTFNEISKKMLGSHDDSNMSIKTGFISGLLAGIGISFIHTPVDLIKCRLQLQTNSDNTRYKSIRHLVHSIFEKEGIKGLYLGGMITFVKESIINSIYFGIYHSIKKSLSKLQNKNFDELGSLDYALAGSLAGTISLMLLYPLEVCKTLIQTGKILDYKSNQISKTIFVDNLHSTKDHILYKYKPIFKDGGIINCTKHIYYSHGFLYLYRGLSVTIFQVFIENGFMFVIFEKMKKVFNKMI